jgi:hypothetical protein
MYPARTCSACGGVARVWETTRKFGVESNAHYRCENGECRRLFTVMTKAGKGVALVLAGPLVLILVAASTIKMSPKDGSMAPMALIVGLLLVFFGVGAVKQLLAERANPVR